MTISKKNERGSVNRCVDVTISDLGSGKAALAEVGEVEVGVTHHLSAGFFPGFLAAGGLHKEIPLLDPGLLHRARESHGMKQMFSNNNQVFCSSG